MTNQADQNPKKQSRRRTIFFRKQRQDEDEIFGFRVGDLESEKDIFITSGASVAGNVSAPSIRIEGIIFGSVTATSVQIAGTGQIWGDIYASEVQIETGSKLHGWVSTFDVGTLELIQSGALSTKDVIAINLETLTNDLSNEKLKARLLEKYSHGRAIDEILHKFKMELGSDLLARKELETMLGSDVGTRKSDELTVSRSEPSMLERENESELSLTALQNELRQKEADLAQLEKALEEANQKIDSLFVGDRGYPWQDAEKYRRIIEERDLYKERFQKLAYWLHLNRGQQSRSKTIDPD